jgi:hypothetical protein
MQDCYLLANISHTNAYIQDHALALPPRVPTTTRLGQWTASKWARTPVLWSGMYSRIGEDWKKVEGRLADWGIGEGEGQTWLLQSRSTLFCIWRMSYGASPGRPSGHSVRAQFAGSIPDIYTRVFTLTQTSSTPLHGPTFL